MHDWANGTRYNAIAVTRHIEAVQAEDPQALIVVLGDHQPPLGGDFRGYRIGGRFAASPGVPILRRANMYATPLVIIDRDAIRDVGRLPAWLIPEVILSILSGGRYCSEGRCAHAAPWRLRPF